MALLRKSVRACKPEKESLTLRTFKESKVVQSLVPIYDSKGNKVSEHYVSSVVKEEIPIERLRHDGLTVDMFSLQTQIDAGVQLKEFNGTFMTDSLSDMALKGRTAVDSIESMIKNKDNYVQSTEE